MEIVCGWNEIHVGRNPEQGTERANGILNHYGNINVFEGKTRDCMAEPHNSVDKTRTQCPHRRSERKSKELSAHRYGTTITTIHTILEEKTSRRNRRTLQLGRHVIDIQTLSDI